MEDSAFISYSHNDERALDRLHKHLAMLQRDGSLKTWSDHKILAGGKLGETISKNLENSTLFMALVSPDYLASNYCYEKEFERALSLASSNRIRIIPIVLEPCDWLASPLSQFMALPKDGKPISEWANQNNAFLDVVTGLRKLLQDTGGAQAVPANAFQSAVGSGRMPRIKQDFDTIQKSYFADKSYQTIRTYFEQSCRELNDAGDGQLKGRFETMGATAFTCTVVNRGKVRGGEAHITVRTSKTRGFGEISYVYQPHADDRTSNGFVRVGHDDYNMFLQLGHLGYSARDDAKLSAEQVSEMLWVDFAKQAGIDYE